MQVQDDYVVEMLRTLVSTDSVNPCLAPGGAGESAVADLVAEWMTDLDLVVTRFEAVAGRPSVVGVLKGSGGGRSLMLNSHLDTVGVEGMERPFEAAVVDGRLYGRGSYDMKGSVAAGLGAVEALRSSGAELKGDLIIAMVADEEHGSLGTSEVLGQFVTDGAIVTEPSDLEICLAHKGFVWIEVLTRGRAAHGSQHQVGIDANMHMGRVLCKLEELNSELGQLDHPLVGSPSLHAALLEGGSGLSTYAAGCSLQIERRTIPGETVEDVEQQISSLLAELSGMDPAFTAEQRILLAREPFEVGPEAHIVKSLEQACRGVLTTPPPHRGENPWMDSALLAAADIETVVIGPRGGGAHADQEWVDLQSVTQLAAILARTAQLYCGVV